MKIIPGSHDYNIIIWDITGQKLNCHSNSISYVAYSPDNQKIFSISNDNTIIIWNANTAQKLKKLLVLLVLRIIKKLLLEILMVVLLYGMQIQDLN